MPENQVDAVRCLQVPLLGGLTLLIPNAAVAEVVAYRAPEPAAGDARLLGRVEWRGQQLQVVSFEALCGIPFRPPARGGQLIVLHRLDPRKQARYYALPASGIPHLIAVRSGTLANAGSADASRPVLQTVSIGGEQALIPDLEQLEALLAD